jgi:hypothetical protein
MTRVIGLAILVLLAAGLPAASASLHTRNAGVVWAQYTAIWGANVDGRDKRVITTYSGGYVDGFHDPAWSPSGQVLAYGSCLSAGCVIHLVRPAGGVKQTLPGFGLLIALWEPTWSPDGRELAVQNGPSGAPILGAGGVAIEPSLEVVESGAHDRVAVSHLRFLLSHDSTGAAPCRQLCGDPRTSGTQPDRTCGRVY